MGSHNLAEDIRGADAASSTDRLLVSGTGAPSNTDAGYAIGCLYIREDGGTNTTHYVNTGTTTSATWTAQVTSP